jgi:urea-proton symporter
VAYTSIASAQMIATSSILSFDIYGAYVSKNSANKQLIRWSHIGVVVTSLLKSILATAFHLGGVNMTWLLYALGNMVNPGVFPICFALLWKGQTKPAAISAPIVGSVCGITVWLSTTYYYFGELTINSTGGTMPNLLGCVTAFLATLPISLTIFFVKPTSFDCNTFNQIQSVKSEHGWGTAQDQA